MVNKSIHAEVVEQADAPDSKSDEDKLTLAKNIITSTKDNKEFLENIIHECFCHLYNTTGIDPKTVKSGYGGYRSVLEKWMETRFRAIRRLPHHVACWPCLQK